MASLTIKLTDAPTEANPSNIVLEFDQDTRPVQGAFTPAQEVARTILTLLLGASDGKLISSERFPDPAPVLGKGGE